MRFPHLPFPWYPQPSVAQGKISYFNHCCEVLGCGWDWGCFWQDKEGERNKGKLSVPTACQLSINVYAPELFLTYFFIDLFVYVVLHDEEIPSTLPPEIWLPLC